MELATELRARPMFEPRKVSAPMQTTAMRARIRPYSARPWPSSAWCLAILLTAQFLIFDMWFLLPLSWLGLCPGGLPARDRVLPPLAPHGQLPPCIASTNPVSGLAFAAALPGDRALLR